MESFTLPSSSRGSAIDVHPESVRLIGYDTRDSTNLSGVTSLNNQFVPSNPLLLTVGATVPNVKPSLGGTEFIVLHLRNLSTNSIFLQNVLINNVKHSWDTDTKTKDLVPTHLGPPDDGQFPLDGKFSIIPIYNGAGPPITQLGTNEMVGDEEVRVIVKLSGNITQDIEMWDALRIQVNYGGAQPAEYIILSGDAKW